MKQSWYFVFSETSIFKKRYIKFYGTRDEGAAKLKSWRLEGFVNAVLAETDFETSSLYGKYKELNVEND